MNEWMHKMQGLEPDRSKMRFYHLPVFILFLAIFLVTKVLDILSGTLIIVSMLIFSWAVPMKPISQPDEDES